jgi:histidinol dehydrogenase
MSSSFQKRRTYDKMDSGLSTKQFERASMIVELAEQQLDRLSQWEQEFMESLSTKLGRFEERTFISTVQWNVLESILDKCRS